MENWKTKYKKRVRISEKNFERIVLIKENKTMAGKIDEILNLYFNNFGGKLEKIKMIKNIKKFKKLLL